MVNGWVAILPVTMVTSGQVGCEQGEKEKGTVRDQVEAHHATQRKQTDTPTSRQAERDTHTRSQ